MRTWIWISSLAVALFVGAGLLLAEPLAERAVKGEAKERGLVLELNDFSLGFFDADLTGATIRLKDVPGIQVDLEEVHLELGLTGPRVRSVIVKGGLVQLDGSLDEIEKQLSTWRAARGSSSGKKASSGRVRTEIVRDLDVRWSNAFGDGSAQTISGIQVERTEKEQRFGADLIEVRYKNLSAQIAGARLTLPPGAFDFSAALDLGASEVRLIYAAEKPEATAPGATGKALPRDDAPKEKPAHQDKAPQENDDSKSPGLASSLVVDNDRVTKVLAGLSLLRTDLLPRLPKSAKVDRLWVTYLREGEKLHVGPSLLTSEKLPGGAHEFAILPQGTTKGTPLSVALTLSAPGAKDAARLAVEGGPVSFQTLGIAEGSFGLDGVEQTTVSGNFTASLRKDGTLVSGGGTFTIEGLTLESGRLADDIVTFPRLVLASEGEIAVNGSRYALSKASLSLGEARFVGDFVLERDTDHVKFIANAEAPLVSCQALLDSAPRGLLGAAERMRFDGTFSLNAGVEADTKNLRDMKVRWDFKNQCRVKAVPGELDPEQFRTVFRREVMGAGNFPVQIEFGPMTASWTPWDQVSPYVEKALLVSEDGRFFRHNGFDNRAIESAILDNVRAGEFVRGASTISMQLAKNLYLSRTKTLSRKFQEAALTSLLEQSFDKPELLELYVNVIEFGPGIYGIRAAAEHYFRTEPARLTPAQAFFLASLLPAPTREYFLPDGSLKPTQRSYIHRLLGISHKRGALTQVELDAALAEELVFGQADTTPKTPVAPQTEKDESGKAKLPSNLRSPGAPSPAPGGDEPIFPRRAPGAAPAPPAPQKKEQRL